MNDSIKLIDSDIRTLENKIQRMLNGEITHKDGTPVRYPQHFVGVWLAKIARLDAKKFKISIS